MTGSCMSITRIWGIGLATVCSVVGPAHSHQDADPPDADAVKAALAELGDLIGGWRGVGQPQRGSSQGAWTERAQWTWEFNKSRPPALRYKTEKSRLLSDALLTFDPQVKRYQLQGTFADKSQRSYTGRLAEGRLVLESAPDAAGDVHRITITRLNEKRTLVLHERQRAGQSFYTRVAEVGYTREGTSLAAAGAGEPLCIVTGGKGTIRVSYQGQDYYVCCTGCQQAFEDDPAGIIAEYKQRLSAERGGR